jgi:prepilin-type N-terminal cleavage/methylation domain-containing protein/prepilin-type processing-associated H-X9-DG protein
MTRSPYRRAFTFIELLVVVAILGALAGLTLPAVQKAREAANRARCQNHLKQIGVALYLYEDAFHAFPPGLLDSSSGDAMPWLSWMGRLLPYIEQDGVYRQAQADYLANPSPDDPTKTPWHAGIRTVVETYTCPSDPRTLEPADLSAAVAPGYLAALTAYLGCSGTNRTTQDGMFYLNSQTRLGDVADGTSNTLAAGERPPSPDLTLGRWYAGTGTDHTGTGDVVLGVTELCLGTPAACYAGTPTPYAFGPGAPEGVCDQFHYWSMHRAGANFLFADASVHFLSYPAASVLPQLATRAAGDVADASQY